MDVFLELPFELSRLLIIDWCKVRDLLALDTAYCNNAKREPWEKVLRSADHFCSHKLPAKMTLAACENWIFARRIPIKKLEWNAYTKFAPCSGYLKDLGDSIEEVTIKYKSDEREVQTILSRLEMHCNHIVKLTCSCCVLDPVLINLLQKSSLKHLKIYDIWGTETEFSDDVSCEGSHHLQLHSLDLFCVKSHWFIPLLLKLLDPCTIQQFCLYWTSCVPQDLLKAFFSLCCNLRALGLNSYHYFGDEELLSLVQPCQSLLHLDISYCDNLTDDIAEALFHSVTQLSTLSISGTKLTDAFLEALAIHCSDSLQALYASHCSNIQEEGVIAVLTSCAQLRTLECMSDCLDNNENLDGLTTLIVWDVDTDAPVWADGHCAKLKHLRLVFHETSVDDFDFTQITVQVLPRLHTLAVNLYLNEDDDVEPASLQELRSARPNLRVCFNTDVLAYDLMKLPM